MVAEWVVSIFLIRIIDKGVHPDSKHGRSRLSENICWRKVEHYAAPLSLERNLYETVCKHMQTNNFLESLCIKAPHQARYHL